jgi:hypothetical protein
MVDIDDGQNTKLFFSGMVDSAAGFPHYQLGHPKQQT